MAANATLKVAHAIVERYAESRVRENGPAQMPNRFPDRSSLFFLSAKSEFIWSESPVA
ncbi:MAG TPA: hypothetical protein VF260_06395 [Bacilli bacterium]